MKVRRRLQRDSREFRRRVAVAGGEDLWLRLSRQQLKSVLVRGSFLGIVVGAVKIVLIEIDEYTIGLHVTERDVRDFVCQMERNRRWILRVLTKENRPPSTGPNRHGRHALLRQRKKLQVHNGNAN